MGSPFDRTEQGDLISLYGHDDRRVTSERYAYTPEFDRLAMEFRRRTRKRWTDREIFLGLFHLRKSGRLPLKGRTGRGRGDDGPSLFPAR